MKIQRLRGMHDIYGQDALLFQRMEAKAREVFGRFGFEEIRTPLLEEKELFSRALGTDTDVVQKEMYEFEDRSKTKVAMRPEGTAGVVRAYLENEFDKKEGLCKFYYLGAMFRSERPQAGRLRQFHQIGVEQLGTDSPYADAETLHALAVFLDEAGASGYKIKLNNLGTFEERKEFKKKLLEYFTPKKDKLCDDCRARLERNVFRLLDCKVESCREIAKKSPSIQGYLTAESKEHFQKVCSSLSASGLAYTEDPFMVRGLDYYTRTVFEVTHPKLGAQDALAAGGRYDRLIESFGGSSAGAVGFAIGMERLAMCLKEEANAASRESLFIVTLGEEAFAEGYKALSELRSAGITTLMDLSPKSMKSQMRLADKHQSAYALILGENELKSGQWVLKNMKDGVQETLAKNDAVAVLKKKVRENMKTFWRTHTCGELTEKNIGQSVTLSGWVDTERDHGGISFVDLRDRYGKTQLVLDPKQAKFEGTTRPKTEECLQISGKVQKRPKGTENTKILTGQIEIAVEKLTLLSNCQTPPFEILKSQDTNEDLRLQYRYLDLRNPAVQKNLFLRHKITQVMRRVLDAEQFVEVETPILTKSTPEGARDYLVPSRVNQGEFYALPQSPQLFKQILMVSGFDRYFQIAKCFRDEDLRADRQPEFTQLDIEMSFIGQEDLFAVVERVLKAIFKDVLGRELSVPFTRLSYQEAMASYGTDKPDLRFGVKIQDLSDIAKTCDFKVFNQAASVSGVCLPKFEASRKEIDDLTEFAKGEGALGLAYFKVEGGKLEAPISKFFKPEQLDEIKKRFDAKDGDLIVFAATERAKAQKILGAIRLHVSRQKNWAKPDEFHFSWITDFPLFKWNEDEKRWDSEHHPFTSPNMAEWEKYKAAGQLEKIRSSAYDLVLNGNELASGSIRIHNRDIQREIFRLIGLEEKEAERRFGFLLRAFEYGPPPHGGIALGLDRMAALFSGQSSIREVIAFPKNQKAVDPMTEAPSPVDERQLKDLGIKIR